jgi:tetratricopeptide (TPR) repeat protein
MTSASLEAVSEYSVGQDLAAAGNDQDAIGHYQRAVDRDPTFGRAYVALARSSTFLGRSDEAAGFWKHALALMDRMSEREKYRTLGLYYLTTARNYEKAVEAGTKLVQMYPADAIGHNNLAIAYFELRNFDKAMEEGRRAVAIYPLSLVIRSNYALYAMYAGAFENAAAEARQVIGQAPANTYFKTYLPLAMAALDSSNAAAVRDAYDRMAKTSRPGRSLSLAGLADAAMYEGKPGDAESVLKTGIEEDRRAHDTDGLRTKQIALAEAGEALGRRPPFPALLDLANAAHGEENIVVPVALMLIRAGRDADAKALAAQLGQQLQPQPRAYAKVIEGEIARRQKRTLDAVEAFQAAQKLSDVWLARLGLGITYLEAEHNTEGLAELELCLKRRGEVTAMFLDDVPSYRYLVPLYYWLGRAQESVGQTQSAAANYKRYVALRAEMKDEAAAGARRRRPVRGPHPFSLALLQSKLEVDHRSIVESDPVRVGVVRLQVLRREVEHPLLRGRIPPELAIGRRRGGRHIHVGQCPGVDLNQVETGHDARRSDRGAECVAHAEFDGHRAAGLEHTRAVGIDGLQRLVRRFAKACAGGQILHAVPDGCHCDIACDVAGVDREGLCADIRRVDIRAVRDRT